MFLIVFLAGYGAMHLYAFAKIKAGLRLGQRGLVGLGLFMLLMLSGPILIHLGAGPSLAIEALAWLIYTWMGIVLIFDTLALIADAARWLTPVRLQPTAGWTLILLLGLTAGLSLAAWQSARTIKTEQLMLRTAKLPVARLRIVQISDVHLGLLVRSERLGLILTAVRRARPDLLVSTGDLLDGELDGLDGLAEQLANISTPCGKFAVLGNHEFYAGAERAAAFTQQAGFRLLRNTSFSGVINIVGVDDPASGARPADLAKLFKGLDQRSFCLLLKHEPTRSAGRFDLQLSGHTHAGQIWPFGLLTRAVYGCNRGLYRLAGGRLLYVSRGSGTWGPQLRLGASPEVTVIDLIRN